MQDKILNPDGSKAYQRGGDEEDRVDIYKRWHRLAGDKLYMTDVDSIEWKFGPDGSPVPVSVVELTRVDSSDVSSSYLDSILDRFYTRDMQGKASLCVAHRLGVPAYLVLFSSDLESFWVHQLQSVWLGKKTGPETVGRVWQRLTKDGYIAGLHRMRSRG